MLRSRMIQGRKGCDETRGKGRYNDMNTDISIPNPVYHTSEQLAAQLGMSLSDFFLEALTAYIAHYQHDEITAQLNQVYQTESSSLDPELMSRQLAVLEDDAW